MQQQLRVGEYDEKLNQMTEQMQKVQQEKGRAFNDLKETKKVPDEINFKVDEVLPAAKRVPESHTGLNPANQSTSNTREETGKNDSINNNIESLKHESRGLELQLAEKDALLDKLKKETDNLRLSEAHATGLLSECKRRVQELETELDKRKESETNLFDTLVMQTKQLEQSKILVEETKLEIASLEAKIKALQGCAIQNVKVPGESQADSGSGSGSGSVSGNGLPKKVMDSAEVEQNIKMLHGTGEGEETLEEINRLKNELKLATEAEENSKKAMDDLALALKEVATEANQVKAKLTLSQVELEHSKGDAERWKTMLESTEDKYRELLDVTKKDTERYKNTAERLRLEAEESLLAWNGKETEFVNWIRRAEDERLAAQMETARVIELLGEAENKIKVSKEENQKLRDILKQALNEANVAKEAAEIAKAENAKLQDSLVGKEDALSLLAQENEMLKIHEAASFENIRELKRLISETSSLKDFKIEDVEKISSKEGSKEDKESGKKAKAHNSGEKEHREGKNLSKTFSLNLKDMIIPHKQQHKVGNEEANNKENTVDDTLRGSIFDEVDSSDSESHHDGDMVIPDDFDHLDESHYDDADNDRSSRKRRALLRRFGDLIRRKSYPRKDPSNEEHFPVTNVKQVP